MATIKQAYGATTAFTMTLASQASSLTAAQEATVINNTTDLYMGAWVYLKLKLATGTPANDKAVYVYGYGSLDGVNYPDALTGVDAEVTLGNPANLRLIGIISAPTSAGIFDGVFLFDGLPPYWGIVLRNYTGIALDAVEASHAASWRGAYLTST